MKKDHIIYYLELLFAMTEKEISTRYKHTFFGFLWIFINPLLQMVVMGVIFQFFMKEPIPNYFYFLFIGLLVWNFFSLSISKTTQSIVFERTLIKKARFPNSVIPLSIILSNAFHTLLAFILVIIPLKLLNLTSFNSLFLIVPATILLICFTIGLSLIFSSLNVKYRDINFFVQAITILWFYVTPIIYPVSYIPIQYQWIIGINPLTGIIELFRMSLLSTPSPNMLLILFSCIFSFSSLIIGYIIFNKEQKYFDDWV